MSIGLVAQMLPLIGVALMLCAAAAAVGALVARSLFALCLCLAAMCGSGAAAVLAFGYGDGATLLALFGVAFAPVVVMGGVLLSARSVNHRTDRAVWLSLLVAALTAVLLLWAGPELIAAPRRMVASNFEPLWLVVISFVTAIACVGLLGHGERGVLEREEGGQ